MIPHNLGEVVAAARWLINHPDADPGQAHGVRPRPRPAHRRAAARPRRGAPGVRDRARRGADARPGRDRPARGQPRPRRRSPSPSCPTASAPRRSSSDHRRGQQDQAAAPGIADVKDLTDRENGTRLVIECKVGVNPQALLADLYRLTPLEQSFGVNNLVLVDGQPQTLGLKALLEVFLAHRYEVVTRRTAYRRTQAPGAAAPGRRPADRAARHRPGGRADPRQRRRAGRQGRR